MQVDFNTAYLTKKCYTPNFKAAGNLRGVVIDNKFYGPHQRKILYNVASAFIYDLYGNALTNKVMQKVEKYFPDCKNNRDIKIVRNAFREKCVVLLSADDAKKHHQIYLSDKTPEVKKQSGAKFVNRLLNNKGQEIYLQAHKHGNDYVIMDILNSAEADKFRPENTGKM